MFDKAACEKKRALKRKKRGQQLFYPNQGKKKKEIALLCPEKCNTLAFTSVN